MKFSSLFLASAVAADLELLGNTAGWSKSGDTFTGKGAWRGRHVFLGKSSGGGMCASSDATIEATLHLDESRYGELGSVMMRADSKSKSMGYTCKLDTRKGQGVQLTREGKKPNNCIHRDFSNGAPTRWDPNALWRADLNNQCFIRDRKWTMFDGATDYAMKMTIKQNADETATIECSIDGELMAWYTDPCPLTGGEYGLATSRNTANFEITSFTDRSCNDVPVEAVAQPSLADGLALAGMGKTAKFWKSSGDDVVTHYYSGACNSHGGKNREAGGGVYGGSSSYGARSDALNVASLKPEKCVKDGFIEADVSLVADYLNGPSRQYGAGSNGAAGLLMRVESDSDGKDHKYGVNYDSWGYLFQVDMTHGKFGVYRGNNGGDHNRNSIAGGYLTGRYRCKNCKCKSGWEGCTQFTKPEIGATHNLRLELSTVKGSVTGEDRTHIKAYLNGTLVADVVDEEHRRYKRYLSGGGPSDETNICGDFGLATYDSDVVSYKVLDYTGYVPKPKVDQIKLELEVQPDYNEMDLIKSIARELGVSADDVSITVSGRRLIEALVVTVTVNVPKAKQAAVEAAAQQPDFTAATGAVVVAISANGAPVKAVAKAQVCKRMSCSYDGKRTDIFGYSSSNEKWHCEKSGAKECVCMCHAAYQCTLKHNGKSVRSC